MKKQELSDGVIVPLITPYHFEDIFPLIDHVINGGISKIFILGTTGEALKLDCNQKKEIIKKVTIHIDNRAELLVGITCRKICDSIKLMNIASENNATVSVLAPLVISDNIASTIQEILSSTFGNLLLYNNPDITDGKFISIENLKPLLFEKRIIGIKDSSADFSYLDELIKLKDFSNFKIYYGRESKLLEALEKNIDGIVPAIGNVDPRLLSDIWHKKEFAPWTLLNELKSTLNNYSSDYLQGLKIFLKKLGLITSDRKLG